MIIVPILLVAVAVIGGINAYRDHQQSVETQRAAAKWGDDLRDTVEQSLKRSDLPDDLSGDAVGRCACPPRLSEENPGDIPKRR